MLVLQKSIASPGHGILAIDESNATCGKRLASIGLDNTETNRQAYRQLLLTTPGLGEYISGAILFEETLYQSTTKGKKFVDCLKEENIMPGIKVDKVCNCQIAAASVILFTNSASPVMLMYWHLFVVFRVWFPYQDQTMNPGAKAWMAWHQDLLSTTSKVPGLLNGELA